MKRHKRRQMGEGDFFVTMNIYNKDGRNLFKIKEQPFNKAYDDILNFEKYQNQRRRI